MLFGAREIAHLINEVVEPSSGTGSAIERSKGGYLKRKKKRSLLGA